jgi:hypothetical protein
MLGMTEVIMDNLNPEWVKDFQVPYKFEEVQYFKAIVYDVDDYDNVRNWDKHDLVGELEFTLHEVATAKDQLFVKPISKGKRDATIEIAAEEVNLQASSEQVIMIPRVEFANMANRGEMLFFLIYRNHGGPRAIWRPVYKSEIHANTDNRRSSEFVFNQCAILVSDLCGDDQDREVKIEFFRSSKSGRHSNLGQMLFTVNELR